jgi:hypothetical protein
MTAMDRIREVIRSRREARRRLCDGEQYQPCTPPRHALDTLARLPLTGRRPITPAPPHPQQFTSPFFKLPPELRHQIYRLVLANRELHIDMRYTAVESQTPHSTAGASFAPDRRWRWRASTCHRHPDAQPIADACSWGGPAPTACDLFDTPCGVGREVLGLLCCCRMAYREVVEVLYAENRFHVINGALVLYTSVLLPGVRAAAVRSLVLQITEETVWDYAKEHLGIERGLGVYRALLERVPDAFPGLTRLMVVAQGSLVERRWADGRMERVEPPSEEPVVKDCLLASMDAAVKGFRRPMRKCVLAMRHRAFDRVMAEERAAAENVEAREDRWLQFWRPLSVAPWRGEAFETGYWVRRCLTKGMADLIAELGPPYE